MMTTSRRRSTSRFALTASGLREPVTCDVKPGHGYYIGASSSPSYVLVLSVTDDTVRYADAYSLAVSQSPRWIFADLACTALATLKKRAEATAAYAASCPERERAFAALCAEGSAGRVSAHGAPVTFADYDSVECRVSAPKGADVYGLAKDVGVVGNWDDDANEVDVECDRGDLPALAAKGLTILSTRTLKTCPTV